MSVCSRCQAQVDAQAIQCPHCGLALKAHGHPGIPLHRADHNTYLCQTCVYDQDDTCNFPQRPLATTCTLYQDCQAVATVEEGLPAAHRLNYWFRRYQIWLSLGGLLLLSIGLVMLRR